MLTFFLGAVLPEEESSYKDDESWRIVFSAPIVVAAIQIILFLFFFKEEPIDYCIGAQRTDEALRLMKRVYIKQADQSDEDFDLILQDKLRQ